MNNEYLPLYTVITVLIVIALALVAIIRFSNADYTQSGSSVSIPTSVTVINPNE